MAQVKQQPPELPEVINADLRHLVMMILAKAPANRPRSAAAVSRILEAIQRGVEPHFTTGAIPVTNVDDHDWTGRARCAPRAPPGSSRGVARAPSPTGTRTAAMPLPLSGRGRGIRHRSGGSARLRDVGPPPPARDPPPPRRALRLRSVTRRYRRASGTVTALDAKSADGPRGRGSCALPAGRPGPQGPALPREPERPRDRRGAAQVHGGARWAMWTRLLPDGARHLHDRTPNRTALDAWALGSSAIVLVAIIAGGRGRHGLAARRRDGCDHDASHGAAPATTMIGSVGVGHGTRTGVE